MANSGAPGPLSETTTTAWLIFAGTTSVRSRPSEMSSLEPTGSGRSVIARSNSTARAGFCRINSARTDAGSSRVTYQWERRRALGGAGTASPGRWRSAGRPPRRRALASGDERAICSRCPRIGVQAMVARRPARRRRGEASRSRPASGPGDHRHRQGAVHGGHGIRRDPVKELVEGEDLGEPVSAPRRPPPSGGRRWPPGAGRRQSGPRARAPVDQGDPFLDRAGSQRRRSWSASGTSSPHPPARAARHASVRSIRARRPATSPSPGRRRRSHRGPRRIASRVRSARRSSAPRSWSCSPR